MSDNRLATSVVKTDFAQSILDCHARCETRYLNLEKGLSDLRELECESWGGSDEELDVILTKLDNDSIVCEKQFTDVKKDNDETFDTTRRTQAGPSITQPSVFKPQTDLKPNFLIKDCTLPEYNKFTETFITYINSSGSVVPEEAIFSNLRVHMDLYWFTELIGKGLHIKPLYQNFHI